MVVPFASLTVLLAWGVWTRQIVSGNVLDGAHRAREHALHHSNRAVEDDTSLSSSIRANLELNLVEQRERHVLDVQRGCRLEVLGPDVIAEPEFLHLDSCMRSPKT